MVNCAFEEKWCMMNYAHTSRRGLTDLRLVFQHNTLQHIKTDPNGGRGSFTRLQRILDHALNITQWWSSKKNMFAVSSFLLSFQRLRVSLYVCKLGSQRVLVSLYVCELGSQRLRLSLSLCVRIRVRTFACLSLCVRIRVPLSEKATCTDLDELVHDLPAFGTVLRTCFIGYRCLTFCTPTCVTANRAFHCVSENQPSIKWGSIFYYRS